MDIVKIALETFGAPIYVRKEIVHNSYVVNDLAEKGAIFVNELDEVPEGKRVIYSAHGVSPAVRQRAKERGLKVVDATCPLVTKVHVEAIKFAKQGYSLVLVGHRDHEEVEGTQGEAPDVTQVVSTVEEVEALVVPDPNKVAYLTQTTLSLDEAQVHDRGAEEEVPEDRRAARAGHLLCDGEPPGCGEERGARGRSAAGGGFAQQLELEPPGGGFREPEDRVLPDRQGARTSSRSGWRASTTVAITAGASAPEVLVQEVVEYLQEQGLRRSVEEVEVMPENVRFGLPPEIVQAIAAAPPRQTAAV